MDNTSKLIGLRKNFKENILKLIDYLIEKLNVDSDLLAVRLFVNALDASKAITVFIKHAHTYRTYIESKDETYFLNEGGSELFSNFESSKILKFRTYWGKLSEEDKNHIWTYFQHFLRVSDQYNKLLPDGHKII